MHPSPSPLAAPPTRDSVDETTIVRSRLRRRLQAPLLVLSALILAAAAIVVAMPEATSEGTLLGASGTVPGGVARINGVLPLEIDGWLPEVPPAVLTEPTRHGTHRVRIVLELTALNPSGLEYSPDDFTITGLGVVESRLLWADPGTSMIGQGEVVTATQVYELPNQAIELVLRTDDARFVLGTGHHTR